MGGRDREVWVPPPRRRAERIAHAHRIGAPAGTPSRFAGNRRWPPDVSHRLVSLVTAALVVALVLLGPLDLPRRFAAPASGVLGELDQAAVAGANPASPASAALLAPSPSASPENADSNRRLAAELAGGTRQRTSTAPERLMGYRWPLSQIRITQPFGPEPGASWIVDGKPFHDGVDVATFCGDHIFATHDGVVLAAGRNYDDFMGWVGDLASYYDRLTTDGLWGTLPIVVVIDDGDGYRSTYAHFSKVAVKAGDTVKAGTLIGYEGRTGNATGCHVHYGLFSPYETATFQFDPKLAAKMLLPDREIARVDPLRALPALPKVGVAPSPTPWEPPLVR